MTTAGAVDRLLASLTEGLGRAVQPGSGLHDALLGGPTPADHYGQTCAALALLLAADDDHWARGRLALQAWLDTPAAQRDHLPFNRLALWAMQAWGDAGRLNAADRSAIADGLARCRLAARYPSNNWTLLALTCRLLEAPPADRAAWAGRIDQALAGWTTPAGAFIDYPARPAAAGATDGADAAGVCTPAAYHHKALFLAALGARLSGDERLARQAWRLADWLVHCWDDAGYAGGWGRSHQALFGDACLIAGLQLLGLPADGPPARVAERLWRRQRRDDGLCWLEPAGAEAGRARWDDYMHLSVYNAWAAALLALARVIGERVPLPAPLAAGHWRADAPGWHHDPVAGIGCWRGAGGEVAVLATGGQPPQLYRTGMVDLRAAGARPVHLRLGPGEPIDLPPCRLPAGRLRAEPALAGQAVLAERGGRLYGVDQWTLRDAAADAQGLDLRLDGLGRPAEPPPPAGGLARLVAAIDWRLLGGRLGRRANLRRRPEPAIRATVQLRLRAGRPGQPAWCERRWTLQPAEGLRWLHPAADGRQRWSADAPAPSTAPTPAAAPATAGPLPAAED